MTPEIWADLNTRLRNLRGDMIGQWQGDVDNRGIEQTIQSIGVALQTWQQAKPPDLPAKPAP